MSNTKREQAAAMFAERWQGKGYEKGESQKYWTELLQEVLGVERAGDWIEFEEQVKLDHTSFIDGHIRRTHVLIEQKSLGKDLRAPIRQSDGTMLTPFQQAKRYAAELPYSLRPRWVVTCNFSDLLVYDMEQPNGEPEHIELKNLGKEHYRLKFLVDTGDAHIQREMEISLKAGQLVGMLYDKLLEQYLDPTSAETLRSLNILCVRLVFCLYAEDAGVFPGHDLFHDYLASFKPQNVRTALIDLFRVLKTPEAERDPYMEENLRVFPYVNGGLFTEDGVEIPRFTEDIVSLLLNNASLGFDWSGISPTIFGAVFESTLNPDTRRSGGMHYTSIANIHKAIDPLFLDEIREEYEAARTDRELKALQDKIARLTFLDPACGSGNFLTETFISLRRIENDILNRLKRGQTELGFDADFSPIKVSINQFYGIEINDFAVTVARTALWIAEHQMLRETQKIVRHDLDFLPLKSYDNIREGDALALNWCEITEQPVAVTDIYAKRTNIVPGEMKVFEPIASFGNINLHTDEIVVNKPIAPTTYHITYDYIIGNPPFVGYSLQSKEQKEALRSIYVDYHGRPYKTAGKIDFVAGWYFKAAQVMASRHTRCAFVSTNSICQGEQVASVWKPLYDRFEIEIDFAYRTFRWDSESDSMAHVHCVIVGFHGRGGRSDAAGRKRFIFDGERRIEAANINAYLLDSPNVFVESRNKALCDVPMMVTGNRPADGGHLIIEADEYDEFVKAEPNAKRFIKRLVGASEFINGKERYCLWLKDATPAELRSMPKVMERIRLCREDRLNAPDEGRRKLADSAHLFRETMNPDAYIAVPRVSSENRRYIPIGHGGKDTIITDAILIIPDATLYHFGILTSNVHMAWTRAVCGRLEMRYRYSKDVVYNNFPWPGPTEAQRAKIEETAQAILDARAAYPDSSLADLYDEAVMPAELRRAHQANDRAVMQAYGFPVRNFTEQDCVARLMEMYRELTTEQ